MEAARQLDSAIKKQPKEALMDEITAVEILRKVLTGNQKDKIPLNSVQKSKQKHKALVKATPVVAEPPQNMRAPTPELQPNYVSDSKDEEDSEDDEATVKRSNCSRSPRTEEVNASCDKLETM